MEVEFTKRWEQGAGGLVGGTEDVEGVPEWSVVQWKLWKLYKHRAVQGWVY